MFEVVAAALSLLVAFAFARREVKCHAGPGCEPEEDGETVEGREGVDVTEAASTRPHRDHDEVDEDGDREPAEPEVPAHAPV